MNGVGGSRERQRIGRTERRTTEGLSVGSSTATAIHPSSLPIPPMVLALPRYRNVWVFGRAMDEEEPQKGRRGRVWGPPPCFGFASELCILAFWPLLLRPSVRFLPFPVRFFGKGERMAGELGGGSLGKKDTPHPPPSPGPLLPRQWQNGQMAPICILWPFCDLRPSAAGGK